MRIATWNINGVNKRLPVLLQWLDATRPDVVALQETKVTNAEFPTDALSDAGYGSITVGQRPWNGVALLARGATPIEIRRSLPGDVGDKQARYVEAAIDGFLFACVYVPNGNPRPGPKYDYKLAWFERLIDHAQTLRDSGLPAVLLGDFNVIPSDADMYATKSYRDNALLQPEVRAAYRRLLAQGWTDSLEQRHPSAALYTFWDYMRNRWPRNAGLRIDHILLSAALAPRLKDANVDRETRGVEGASDHAPAWVRLSKR